MNFKVGDRIRVYATLNEYVAESKGRVTGVRSDGMLLVTLDTRNKPITAHPKQCRKLKPTRRTIWIMEGDLRDIGRSDSSVKASVSREKIVPEDVEFREVLKKKKTPTPRQ